MLFTLLIWLLFRILSLALLQALYVIRYRQRNSFYFAGIALNFSYIRRIDAVSLHSGNNEEESTMN